MIIKFYDGFTWIRTEIVNSIFLERLRWMVGGEGQQLQEILGRHLANEMSFTTRFQVFQEDIYRQRPKVLVPFCPRLLIAFCRCKWSEEFLERHWDRRLLCYFHLVRLHFFGGKKFQMWICRIQTDRFWLNLAWTFTLTCFTRKKGLIIFFPLV